ncbi:transposase family protein [Rhodococcus aetherivorans]
MDLFPHLDSVDVLDVRRVGATIRIEARPRDEYAVCPRSAGEARRVHSRYRRQLADTAIGGYPVLIDIRVRRFFCDTIDCATKTFAEQLSGLTLAWSRRTPATAAMIAAIGLAVAGRAGARLADRLFRRRRPRHRVANRADDSRPARREGPRPGHRRLRPPSRPRLLPPSSST